MIRFRLKNLRVANLSPWINKVSLLGALVFMGACTTLGPTPTLSGQSVVPELSRHGARPDVEVQMGAVPGYYLSSAAVEEAEGAAIGQIAAMFDPGELIKLPGLGVGGRYISGAKSGQAYFEPMLRYRLFVDEKEDVAMGFVAYGNSTDGTDQGASFSSWRIGGEYGVDYRATPVSSIAELHVLGGFGLMGIDASGSYCQRDDGYAQDCEDGQLGNVDVEAGGIYPTLFGGLGVEFGRNLSSAFHGVRLSAMFAAGQMPRVRSGEQQSASVYTSGGLTLGVMFGGI